MHRIPLPALALVLTACASAPRGGGPPALLSDESDAAALVALPPLPRASGPLDIRVVYPRPGATIASRDSNFILGAVGDGAAALTINGVRVPVLANGAFLAFLPVPPDSAPRYDLVAVAGPDTARATLPVRLPPPRVALPADGVLAVDSASLTPGAGLALRDDENVRVSVRAPVNASVWAVVPDSGAGGPPHRDGTTRSRDRADRGVPARTVSPRAEGKRRATPAPAVPRILLVRGAGASELWATDVPAGRLRRGATLLVARGGDTLRLRIPAVASTDSLGAVTLTASPAAAGGDTDRVVVARPTPGGTYKWFFLPGTVLPVTGRSGGWLRVRLDRTLDVWVGADDARPLPAGAPLPRRVAGNARVEPAADWADVVIPTGERPPYHVEEEGSAIVLTLYGTTGNSDIVRIGESDSLVRHVTWMQEGADRARYTVHLARAPYGYQVLWNGSALVLRVRRPPPVDPRAPLRGLTIAVDPGHPPIGATGPTGLYEAVPALAVGERVRALLAARGANVVMTRLTPAAVALGDRPVIARRANAHALVSIHLNALPDGVNPFRAHGTGTYYFHPQSVRLARAVQRGLVRRMGLRDLGIYYDNLALVRPTWMPAVLAEGAFMMIPEQEAALRTPEFQEAYARGVVEGLERYFAGLAAER